MEDYKSVNFFHNYNTSLSEVGIFFKNQSLKDEPLFTNGLIGPEVLFYSGTIPYFTEDKDFVSNHIKKYNFNSGLFVKINGDYKIDSVFRIFNNGSIKLLKER